MEEPESIKQLATIYAHLTKDQLQEADKNLGEYLEVVSRIYEHITADPMLLTKQRMAAEEEK